MDILIILCTDVRIPGPEQPSCSIKVIAHCEVHKGNLYADHKVTQLPLCNCDDQAPGDLGWTTW